MHFCFLRFCIQTRGVSVAPAAGGHGRILSLPAAVGSCSWRSALSAHARAPPDHAALRTGIHVHVVRQPWTMVFNALLRTVVEELRLEPGAPVAGAARAAPF